MHTYDIASHQQLRTLGAHKGLAITHLATLLRPPDLVGHVSLTLAAGTDTREVPVRPVAPFQRMRDARTRELHEVAMMLPPRSAVRGPFAACGVDAALTVCVALATGNVRGVL